MYWFIVLFPLMIYPWGYDPYYTLPKVVYLDIFVLGSWLYIILRRKYLTINLKKPTQSAEFIVFIFICLVGISTAFSVNKTTSLYGTKDRYEGFLTLFSYGSVLLFSYRFLNQQKLEKLIHGIALISILVSVYGILQHYLVDFLPRNSQKVGWDRSYAFFDNPNFFGSYLVLVILLTASLYLISQNKKETFFYYITIVLAFTSLIFSGTRSGWLGSLIGVLFVSIFVVLKRKNLWKRWAALLCTFALILTAINLLEKGTYVSRMNSVVSDTYQIASNQTTGHEGSSRFFIWEKTFPLLKDYFWTGSGPDTLQYIFPATPDEKVKFFGDRNAIVDRAHNEFLQVAVTLGSPALVTYLYLLVFVLRRAIQAVKIAKGNDRIFLWGLVSAIIGYLVQAFLNISVVPVAPLFWATLGITLAKSESYLVKEQYSNHQDVEKYLSA